MIHIIGIDSRESQGAERSLSASGLAEISNFLNVTEDLYVYGCGSFVPGQDYDELVAHSQAGDLLGIIALWFTESAVSSLAADLRAHLGAILQLAPLIYVPDKLGADNRGKGEEGNGGWCLHYGVSAKLGGHPAWCTPAPLGAAVPTSPLVETEVGGVISAALAAQCFSIKPPDHPWGSLRNVVYAEVRRFVEQVGLTDHLQHPAVVSPEILIREHMRAITTVSSMVDHWREGRSAVVAVPGGDVAASVWSRVAGACAASKDPADMTDGEIGVYVDKGKWAAKSPVGRPASRELIIGTPFDPTTHYDDAYYGEGAGLIYTRTDGKKELYHGPAHEWDGMRVVAELLKSVYVAYEAIPDLHERPRLIDIGCGSGCFVSHARKVDFNAIGYDISSAAVARAEVAGRSKFVFRRNVVTDPVDDLVEIVTALDFWEHIYLDDIDPLIDAVRESLDKGGIGFFIICTRTAAEQDWTIKPGDCFTKENSWCLAAGHVTIRRWGWWLDRFESHGLEPQLDFAHRFQVLRDEMTGLSMVDSWRPKNLVVVTRK